MKDAYHFCPRGVVCSRVKGSITTFDAEITFGGKQHWLIQSGLKTREEARKIADAKAEEIIKAMTEAANNKLEIYPKAEA